ncbi:MAG: hypothetical protein QOG19_2681 [Mycobacterium sp.]|nr:hypothetical protein [Mycobacterium sp.]
MARVRRSWLVVALFAAAVVLGACTSSIPGRAVRAGGRSPASTSARELLLQDGDNTPLGPARAAPVADNYFTSVRPKECSAALLFKGSPLRPRGATDSAEAAYSFGGQALYAESIDVYDRELDTYGVAWSAFSEVSDCRGDAVGVSPSGDFDPMHVTEFGAPQDDVMTWSMGRPDWTCSYGVAAVTKVALVIAACDAKPGFPMAEWAAKRKAQLDSRTA